MAQVKREAPHVGQKIQKRKITKKAKLAIDGSFTEVLLHDVRKLLAEHSIKQNNSEFSSQGQVLQSVYNPPERFQEIEVKISELSSTGDGLALSEHSDHVYVVPFSVPGDVVKAKVVNYFAEDKYTLADFVNVIKPSSQRDDSRIKCPYFANCSGCQFQMLSYEDQLAHKRMIIERAYKNFSNLAPEVVPSVTNTVGSPMQYGYRTKLTPHFDGPPGRQGRGARKDGTERKGFAEVPPIGFMMKGMRRTIDIEDCPIGTDAVRQGMRKERERVAKEIQSYKRGATILLRESTTRKSTNPTPIPPENGAIQVTKNSAVDSNIHDIDETSNAELSAGNMLSPAPDQAAPTLGLSGYSEEKTCITDSNAIATEYIDSYVFHNAAGSFFQNNNSILPQFTAYIRDHILPPSSPITKPVKYLIDAYCGSGLFTITLSSLFSASTGIDISPASIASAHQNAQANNIKNAKFSAADASALFADMTYPAHETVVVIDPPRKGCDENFLRQLLHFGPQRVVYVSCNVHTQARDVGVLVEGSGGCRYGLESLQGFDFFPQTGHVESVAILNRLDGNEEAVE
ncbi:tRNA(m5U54)methyltransferase [Lambiella insularis]|nr:tRNA(m5U54)methyltransferase [Lambiella insularis]